MIYRERESRDEERLIAAKSMQAAEIPEHIRWSSTCAHACRFHIASHEQAIAISAIRCGDLACVAHQ